MTAAQLVKGFPAFIKLIERGSSSYSEKLVGTLFWTSWIPFIISSPISLRSLIILPSQLLWGVASGFLHLYFLSNILLRFSFPSRFLLVCMFSLFSFMYLFIGYLNTLSGSRRKVAGLIPDEVIGFFLIYLILPAALWPWGWLSL
jgi:hypothetical protein